jgi:hypothetical protein
MDKQKVAKIKLSDKNNSAQTEAPKMNTKPKKTASEKTNKKYYHNGNKNKSTAKSNEAPQ